MSSQSLDPELSSAELRSKLFHSFKSKGVVQSVKTQLRKQLALDLHEKAITRDSTRCKDFSNDGVLFQRICNSLFVDHLKRCLYDYTLSVFISESSTNLDQTIPTLDILELLHIRPNSKLYDVLSNACTYGSNAKGFLWTFLTAIAQEHRNPAATMECSVQTEEVQGTVSLDRKMFEIEKTQLAKLQSSIKGDYQSVQEKLLMFQRQYELKKQEELKTEMERFRSTELTNMRIEERERCREEFQSMKTEYERMYNSKLKQLERKETEAHEKVSRQEKEFEKEGYEQRQKIMEEMDAIKQRDMELKREQKSALSCIEVEERKLKSKEEELKQKEKSIKEMEEYYENKLKHETLRIKVEYQEKDLEKARILEVREHELKDEMMNFQTQKLVYLKWKDEADRLAKDNEHVSMLIEKTKQSHECLNQKYENVCEKYNKVTDYEDIKHKNIILQKDLEICQKNLADVSLQKAQERDENHKLVKDLLAKINQASFESENNMRLLQEKERSVSLKHQVLQTKYDILQKKHSLHVKKNEELRKLYEEILLSQRELGRECDELKLQLQFGVPERERSVQCQDSKSKLLLPNILAIQDVQTSMPRNNKKKVKVPELTDEDMETAMDIEESNKVLKRLEKEAMELENSYQQFQERQHLIKSQLPQYIEKTKVAIETTTMEMQRSYDNYREDLVNASQTLRTLQSDSFNISHLIPSRRLPESNTGRSAPKYSTPVTCCEATTLSPQTFTSSFRVTELNQLSSTDSFPKKQDDVTQPRMESKTHQSTSLEQNDAKRRNEVPLTDTIPSMRSLTQIPLTETIHPLTETIQPITSINQMAPTETPYSVLANSLTQILLTESIPAMSSLTQIPLTETIFQIEKNKSHQSNEDDMKIKGKFEMVESANLQNSLTQILLTESIQPTSSLTQMPLTDTICRIEENKSHFANIPPPQSYEDEMKIKKDKTIENIDLQGKTTDKFHVQGSATPSASALRKMVSHIETFESPITSSSNLYNDDFVDMDIFKTTNFMAKGLQSTGLVSSNVHGHSIEESENSAGSNEKDKQEYSMQDSEVKSIHNLSEKSDNLKADSLGIAYEPSDSEHSTNLEGKAEDSSYKDLSVGEVEGVNIKSMGETSKSAGEIGIVREKTESKLPSEEPDNPMDQYMQMILEKRKAGGGEDIFDDDDGEDIFDDGGTKVEKENSAYDDISLSQSEGQNKISTPLSSDFEW